MASSEQAPAFSVVVPAYNAESRIGEVIGSVLAQRRTDLELIVVDDGSGDGTRHEAERAAAGDPRVRVLGQANQGTVAARNAGIALARGRFVSLLDDDDLWLPSYLGAVAEAFERAPEAGIAHTDAWVLGMETGAVGRRTAGARFARPIRRLDPEPSPAAAERALLRVNFITTCTATVRAQALAAVGELDPAIRGCDDWDLWLRILAAGFTVARVDEPHAVLRKRSDSVGADQRMMGEGSRLVLDRALRRGLAGARSRRIARRHLRLVELELGARSGIARWLAGGARRLGRKRLPLPGGERPAPEDLRRELERIRRSAQPEPGAGTGS